MATLASGLVVPWALAILPDGRMLVTERPGRVRVIAGGRLLPDPALTLPVASASGTESGLLGLAVHPGYPTPPYVYLFYTRSTGAGLVSRVSRFTVLDPSAQGSLRLGAESVILDGLAGGSCCHFGGRLAFGPDGDLYVTVGDGQVPTRAWSTASLNGKVLRLKDDGSVPADNPIPGSPVFGYGLRNPEGLAWDAAGNLYASDNGPTGEAPGGTALYHHDRLDLVRPGQFLGWPLITGASTPTGLRAPSGLPAPGAPLIESGSEVSWAPSGASFFALPGQRPTLLIAELRGTAVLRVFLDPADPARVVQTETVLTGFGRMRDVVTGRDGCVYVLTSNRDGRG
ncbi:MAG: PQQ-dependent sugar dehydrogenase, partial [Candidatus Dormibacteraeota bacterium]|nr:PQQ-dependent sugar dehydrogenase [Candidatus Dormibacteraeota bacterium]